MPPRFADLSADLDALYRAPLAEFIERRNALTARVKVEQGKESAAAIKAMVKPSGTAWVVNQLFWRDARDFERLMKAGEQLRAVQQARLAGHEEADMNAAREARQTALSALMAKVSDLLAEAGLSSSHAMRQRVSTTLEALSIYGGREPGPRPGRLTEDVDPPGFGTLAALVPASGGSPFSFAAALTAALPTGKASGLSTSKAPAKPVPAHAKATSPDDDDAAADDEAEAGEGRPAGGDTAKKGSAASGSAVSGAAASGGAAAARPKLRAIDTRRMAEAKSAFDQAEADAAEAQSTSDAAESARQKSEAAWQRAKAGLDAAQKALDEAMEWEREAMELRDASRKAATAARQAADRAGRTRDQAERAYEESRGR